MPFDANKLYCSEILAILLQNNDSKCVSVNGLLLPNDVNASFTLLSPLSFLKQTENALPLFPFLPLFLHFLCSVHFLPHLFVFSSFPLFSTHLGFFFSLSLTSFCSLPSFSPSFLCPHLISPFLLPLLPFFLPLAFQSSHLTSFLPLSSSICSLLHPFPLSLKPCKAPDSHRTIRSLDRFSLMVQATLLCSGGRVSFYTHSPLLQQCCLH